MIQRSPSRDTIAEAISTCIVESVRPWRIVLFGSRARGDAKEWSDYDVYVEVDADEESLREIHNRLSPAVDGEGYSVDLKVNRRGSIERRRNDPGTIEWDVAREGRLLYADPAAPTVLMPPSRVREPSPDAPESVAEWMESAERDLRLARHLLETTHEFWPDICWHSHGTVEKHMKALLVSRRVRPKRTHKLGALLAALRLVGCALPGLDNDCTLLTPHAITPRYPAGRCIGEDAARAALAAAERIVAAVTAEFPHNDDPS